MVLKFSIQADSKNRKMRSQMKFLVNSLQGREIRDEGNYMYFDIQDRGNVRKIITGAKKYFGSVDSRLLYGRKRINR